MHFYTFLDSNIDPPLKITFQQLSNLIHKLRNNIHLFLLLRTLMPKYNFTIILEIAQIFFITVIELFLKTVCITFMLIFIDILRRWCLVRFSDMALMIIEYFIEILGEFGMLEETINEMFGNCLREHLGLLSSIMEFSIKIY